MALHADHLDLREQYTMESIIETWTTNMDPIIERAALTCESASLSSGSDSDSTANPSNSDCNSPGTIACLASGSDSNIGTDSNDEEITKSPPVVTLKSTKSTNPSETLLELFTDEDSSTVTVGNSVGKAKIIENATDEEDLDEFDEPPGNIASNKSMSKCNAPLVRLETNGMLKCIKAKQLCDDGRVKFDESKAIWMVNDCEKWFLVTVFPNYGCSCVDTPSCCHVLGIHKKVCKWF